MAEFVKRSRINAPAAKVFAWHEHPDALRKLIPPWTPIKVVKSPSSLHDEARAVLRLRVGPVRMRWVAKHRGYENRGDEGGEFTDVQVYGPFKSWEHTHRISPEGAGTCILEDHVKFELPMGPLGRMLGHAMTRRRLERMFEYRHRIIKAENEAAAAKQARGPGQGG